MSTQATTPYSDVWPVRLYGIQERFETFHQNNPQVYTKLVEFARQVKAAGVNKYNIKSLFERLRWFYQFDVKTSDRFKLNNNYHSRYARLIMRQESDLKGFFSTRELIS